MRFWIKTKVLGLIIISSFTYCTSEKVDTEFNTIEHSPSIATFYHYCDSLNLTTINAISGATALGSLEDVLTKEGIKLHQISEKIIKNEFPDSGNFNIEFCNESEKLIVTISDSKSLIIKAFLDTIKMDYQIIK